MIFLNLSVLTITLGLFLHLKSPMILCLALIALSLTLSLITILVLSKWIAYSIILIFLGGMMIVFLYISSMTLNTKVSQINISPPTFSALLALSIILAFTVNTQYSPSAPQFETYLATSFSLSSAPLIFFLIAYLLLALFTVVSLAQSFKGAVHKMWA